MLERARHPIGDVEIPADRVTLIEGDFLTHEFSDGEFDLVYAIGVLGEHSPFDETIASRVKRWLRPGGRFAFTTVHPSSSSVPRTVGRRLGEALAPVAPGPLRRHLRARLMSGGLYADERRVAEVLGAAGLDAESIEHSIRRASPRARGRLEDGFGTRDLGFDEPANPDSNPEPQSRIPIDKP
jgi:SAM-dependent methyltransferase